MRPTALSAWKWGRELLARVKSVLRRANAFPPNLRREEVRWLRFAGWRLDAVTRNLSAPDGVVVPLLPFKTTSAANCCCARAARNRPNASLTSCGCWNRQT